MPTDDISTHSTCTTCSFNQDFSNYWTANLYFKARNGTYKRVPQIPNQAVSGNNGGITVYYTSPGAKQTTAFKPVRNCYILCAQWMYRAEIGDLAESYEGNSS
jgi:hypothetical protein